MRIAYIGNFEPPYSTENDIKSAIHALDHECVSLQENATSIEAIFNEALQSDLVLITSTWDDAIPLDKWLDLMHACALKGIPTATIHLDTFWVTSRGGRRWWLSPMFHTAYIFTADGDHQDKWTQLGKNHIWLPPAVRHTAVKKGKWRNYYACDVAFVGSNGRGYHEDVWQYRTQLVDSLRDMCARNNWTFKNPGGDHPKIERDDNMNDFYASAKVTVGDSLCVMKEEANYWSDRVPEATGRYGYLIMPKIKALDEMYNRELPMYDWGDFKQLEKKIKSALKYPQHRMLVKDACFDIAKSNTYVDRVKTILEVVGLGG